MEYNCNKTNVEAYRSFVLKQVTIVLWDYLWEQPLLSDVQKIFVFRSRGYHDFIRPFHLIYKKILQFKAVPKQMRHRLKYSEATWHTSWKWRNELHFNGRWESLTGQFPPSPRRGSPLCNHAIPLQFESLTNPKALSQSLYRLKHINYTVFRRND